MRKWKAWFFAVGAVLVCVIALIWFNIGRAPGKEQFLLNGTVTAVKEGYLEVEPFAGDRFYGVYDSVRVQTEGLKEISGENGADQVKAGDQIRVNYYGEPLKEEGEVPVIAEGFSFTIMKKGSR